MIQDLEKVPRFFHASSSEIFGKPDTLPQNEQTPFRPVNPYGAAKAFATNMVSIYRNTFGLFAVNGIMFNHESPRRGENFVTRKICRAAAAIKAGRQKELLLGDTTAKRDWGHARDYVRGMWLSLQHATAEDYVFATGKLNSVQDVVEIAFATMELDWSKYVAQDQRFMRPAEPQKLVGDPKKASRLLNWTPETSFRELIEEMTQIEFKRVSGQVVSG
jgi:GDPmannose 4,6-dehydratase